MSQPYARLCQVLEGFCIVNGCYRWNRRRVIKGRIKRLNNPYLPLHKLGWRSSPGRVLVSGLLGHERGLLGFKANFPRGTPSRYWRYWLYRTGFAWDLKAVHAKRQQCLPLQERARNRLEPNLSGSKASKGFCRDYSRYWFAPPRIDAVRSVMLPDCSWQFTLYLFCSYIVVLTPFFLQDVKWDATGRCATADCGCW